MAEILKVLFDGEQPAIKLVAESCGLSFEAEGERFWVWGDALQLSQDSKEWRHELESFSRKANAIIALSDPTLGAIHPYGSVLTINGDRHHHVLLVEPVQIEITGSFVTLMARGGGPPARPLADRVPELCARLERFERAANILAECGNDLVKLYFVMELVERAHGGFPPKKKRKRREEFCRRIEVEEREWEALHRTARPFRHAEPHEEKGPVLSPQQARILLQHVLKLWLIREVPI